jgi:hypothetical protein
MYLAEQVMQAHAGGWDEMLIIAGPLIVIVGLMRKARSNRPPDDPDQPDHNRRNDAPRKEDR